MMPFSVMMAETRWLGVTSKAGLKTLTPRGATLRPWMSVTYSGARSSMVMSAPVGVSRSTVESGEAT